MPGFTLIELMVAVGVTVILVIAVARVFSVATEAVGKGMGISEVLGKSRIVGEQISRDFGEMVGPAEGGVLVIVSQVINSAIVPDDADSGFKKDCRADQVMFIRRRGTLEPLAPAGSTNYSADSSANYVRVWFGHLKRANADGSESTGDLGASPNQLASAWMLGRHGLFLQTADPTNFNAHANGGAYRSTVTGYSASGSAHLNLYGGLVDVAEFGLSTESANGAMVGQNENDSADKNQAANTTGLRLYVKNNAGTAPFPADDYRDRVYDYIFVKERLLANPLPDGKTYESWRVAQMHPILSPNVSEFRVDFAGDYDATPGIDEVSATGAIQWYGLADTAAGVIDPVTVPGAFNNSSNGQSPILDTSPNSHGASLLTSSDRVFIFRHGDGATKWPYLIRIRYRVHDSRNRTTDSDGDFGQWFEQIMAVNRDG